MGWVWLRCRVAVRPVTQGYGLSLKGIESLGWGNTSMAKAT